MKDPDDYPRLRTNSNSSFSFSEKKKSNWSEHRAWPSTLWSSSPCFLFSLLFIIFLRRDPSPVGYAWNFYVPSSRRCRASGCSLFHLYCSECISQHIKVSVQANRSKVGCPTPGCAVTLDPLSCRPILPPDVFVRWCDVLIESMVHRLPRAYCPFAGCSALVVSECGAFATRAPCPSCRRAFCFQCKAQWHAGYRCHEYRVKKGPDDALFDRLAIRMGWRRCPRCRSCVEHLSSCRRMTCRCCFDFCYNCGSRPLLFHECIQRQVEEFKYWTG